MTILFIVLIFHLHKVITLKPIQSWAYRHYAYSITYCVIVRCFSFMAMNVPTQKKKKLIKR